MLVEPISNLLDQLYVGRSLSSVCRNQILIQIMNISPSPVKVYKGMKLGTVIPSTGVLLVSDEDLQTDVQSPSFDHIQFPSLSTSERTELINFLKEFCDIFSPSNGPIGHTSAVKHSIPTTGAPIRQQLCRVPESLKDTVKAEVNRMLEHNVIRPSTSPWSSPIVMVRMNDGSWHFYVDYRKLNLVTHRDAYPLPRTDATLDSFAGCKYFTTLDLASGYWQVTLEESDKEKTAFSTLQGHYEFNVMPFGLTNAPATFQRFMECALAGLTNEQCLIYLDDIIVFSSSFVEHLQRLRNIFVALRQARLQLKLSKCTFASTTVYYLGHVVSATGVKPDPHKIEAVSQYPAVPTNIKELKKFLGLVNYYRKFIYNYATIAEPLNKLLRGHKKQFLWTVSCQQAFDHLKSKLVTSPILGYPDFATPFVLYTDASDAAIGGVLSQFQHNNEVVSYWSHQLTKAERNYSTIEREALAVVGAVKEFYPYLHGFKFKLITDHNPLVSLKDLKDMGGRLVRWMLFLQQFDYSFEHRHGKNHANADTMSRLPATGSVLAVFQQLVADSSVIKAAQECRECQRRNPPQVTQQAPLESIVSQYPFENLSWDIMGPLPQTSSGNKYIVVVTDLFSKWVEAFPVKCTDSETLASLLVTKIVYRYGVPSYLHSDQGANLTSNLMAAVCKHLGIAQKRTSAYHPQGNGQVERLDRTLESMLAKVVSEHQTDWDYHLPQLLFAYRTAIHDTTGFTPFHITFGCSPVLPLEAMIGIPPQQRHKDVPSFVAKVRNSLHTAYATVRANITSAHQHNKEHYDKNRPFLPYSVGDLVWLHVSAVNQEGPRNLLHNGKDHILSLTEPVM